MNSAEATDSAFADIAALEQITSLLVHLNARMSFVTEAGEMSPREVDVRVSLIREVWVQLDELGVDLNLPDLKTLVAAHVATHPTSSGAVTPDAAQEAMDGTGAPEGPPPAPLDPTQPGYFEIDDAQGER